jgi:hypothetical protein
MLKEVEVEWVVHVEGRKVGNSRICIDLCMGLWKERGEVEVREATMRELKRRLDLMENWRID